MGVPVYEQCRDCAVHLVCNSLHCCSAYCYSINWCVGVSVAVLFYNSDHFHKSGEKKRHFHLSSLRVPLNLLSFHFVISLTISHALLHADHKQYWPGSKALPNLLVEGAALDAVNPNMLGDVPAHRLRTCVLYVCV